MWCNGKCRKGECQWCDGTPEQLEEAIDKDYDSPMILNLKNSVYGILNKKENKNGD